MKASFSITKIDDINLKKYNVILRDYKKKIQKITEILFNLPEIKKSSQMKDFQDISRVKFDISFCNNETIREINKNYRNKDYATDVITFSLFCDDDNKIIYRKTAQLGQIVLSVEKADEQKTSSLEEEVLTLITHGILHLLGFDHLTKKDYDFVINIQKTVIRNFNE